MAGLSELSVEEVDVDVEFDFFPHPNILITLKEHNHQANSPTPATIVKGSSQLLLLDQNPSELSLAGLRK